MWLHSQRGRDPRVLVEPEHNPRLAVLLDLLWQIEGKTVVIYRHRYSFKILSEALQRVEIQPSSKVR